MSDKKYYNKEQRDVEIDLRDEIAQGDYSNLVIISHSPTEFILDFASMLPGIAKPRVSNRIILTPEHAKRLLSSLQNNVNHYESKHGAIANHPASTQEMLHKIGEA